MLEKKISCTHVKMLYYDLYYDLLYYAVWNVCCTQLYYVGNTLNLYYDEMFIVESCVKTAVLCTQVLKTIPNLGT